MIEGWEMKKLGDVCKTGSGGTPLKAHKDYYENGDIPWILSGEVEQREIFEAKNFITKKGLENSSAKLFPPNTVLIAMYGANAGQIGVLKFEACTNQAVCGILPNKNTIPEYIYYCFLSKKEELVAKATGNAQPNISQIKIKETEIPVPPLPEQQRIVAYLDATFASLHQAKANLQKNLQNAKELFETELRNVFENKGEGWEEKSLGEIGKVSMCKRILKEQTLPVGDIPFYKIGTFGKTPNAFISKEIYNEFIEKYSFPKIGDILISASGTIGRCVIYDGKPAYFQDSNIVWIDNNEKQVLNNYLNLFYSHCNWNPSRGATISRLYNDDLRRIKIPFPKSLKTQKEIVAKLDALKTQTQQLESVYQTKLNNTEELYSGILKRAFETQLIEA